jgi:hypothetical protein
MAPMPAGYLVNVNLQSGMRAYSKHYKRGCCFVLRLLLCLLSECEEWRGDGRIRLLYICKALFLEIPSESQPHHETSCLVSNVVVPSAVAPTLEVSSGCQLLRHASSSEKGLAHSTTTNNDTPTTQERRSMRRRHITTKLRSILSLLNIADYTQD